MKFLIVLVGFSMFAVIGYLLYAAIMLCISALGMLLLIAFMITLGIYVSLMNTLGPVVTWLIIIFIWASILLASYRIHEKKARERQAEDERQRQIAAEAKRALEAADQAANAAALAKPWHDRSLDDWKRVWLG